MRATDEIIAVAEELLEHRFGGEQHLTDPEDLGGSGSATVIRCRVAPSPLLQARSLVIKYSPATGDPFDDAALIREVVSYQFTTSLPTDVRPGPELLAYDINRRLLVIGDSGDGDTYADLLDAADDDTRVTVLRRLGAALGRMHAGTADREQHFDILLHRMLQRYPNTADIHRLRDETLTAAVERGMEIIAASGVTIPDEVVAFAHDSTRRLVSGQHRAFTPFDLSPDNILLANNCTHFLDYEWAGYRDATFDVACVVAGFPQFLSSRPISDHEADVFIDAWVAEVSRIWPNTTNPTRLRARIITALVGWAMSSVALLHYGSMSQTVAATGDRVPVTGLSEGMAGAGDDTALLVRRDLVETFSALSRFAARGGDDRFVGVQTFADDTLALLHKLGISH